MTTYSLIIQSICKQDSSHLFSYRAPPQGEHSVVRMLFLSFAKKQTQNAVFLSLRKLLSVRSKFAFLNETLKCFYVKGRVKEEEECIHLFCSVQKIYNALRLFANVCRHKIAKTVVNTDMSLSEIVYGNKNVMCIMHKKSKYLFHIQDLMRIIKTALSNSYMFFAEPLPIKNPYNNLPFEKSILYNIYLFMKFNTHYYCPLLHEFFLCDFNLNLFTHKHEHLLREYAINNYVYKSPTDILYKETIQMLKYFNEKYAISHNYIAINADFPKKQLVSIFQPYLLLYFSSQYAYTQNKRNMALIYFRACLRKFQWFNPLFGNKIYKPIIEYTTTLVRKIVGTQEYFDDRHIPFNDAERENAEFLTNHLEYNEGAYNATALLHNLQQPALPLPFETQQNEPDGDDDSWQDDEHSDDSSVS